MIQAQTNRIKMSKQEAHKIAEETRLNDESNIDARERLGSLVKQPTRRVLPVFGESNWRLTTIPQPQDKESTEQRMQGDVVEPERGGVKVKATDKMEMDVKEDVKDEMMFRGDVDVDVAKARQPTEDA